MTPIVSYSCFSIHRSNVFLALSRLGISSGLAYLRGDHTHSRHNTDTELPFRQESNFFYITGVDLPNYHVILDIANRSAHLFAPDIPADEAVWIGRPPSLATQCDEFGIPVQHTSSLSSFLTQLHPSTIHILDYESDLSALGDFCSIVDRTYLTQAFITSRIYKTEAEIALMQRANDISSLAHKYVMEVAQPQLTEDILEAHFRFSCHKQGAKHMAYLPIIGVGANAAILHYGQNSSSLSGPHVSEHALILVDAGCSVHNYASDITRTFPVTGKFTPIAKSIYEAVLDAQVKVIAALKPGIEWEDMHRLTERTLTTHLRDLGILKRQFSVDKLLASHAYAIFFPHGVGHLIGLDVHDVGGYPNGIARIPEPSIKYLRMRRKLEPGMVVTVEPGLYFVPLLIEQAKSDSTLSTMIDFDMVAKYIPVGGVRIEDNILITKDGYRNLTTVVKTVAEIEEIMANNNKVSRQ